MRVKYFLRQKRMSVGILVASAAPNVIGGRVGWTGHGGVLGMAML